MFITLDKNGDGSLSLDELKIGLGGMENGESILKLLEAADTDNSGQIDYTEFIAATLDSKVYMKKNYLRTAFDMFDKDNSGKIDVHEILEMIGDEHMKDVTMTKE